MEDKGLTREEIIGTLVNTLEPVDFVYGMWQCGSAAFGRIDQWSDIDIIVDVEDDRVNDVFDYTDRALEGLSPIESSFEGPQPMSQGAYQKAYRLQGTSKFLMIEICAVKHSSPQKFLEKEIHNEVLVHFDKKDITNVNPIDKDEFANKLESRIQQLEDLFSMYQCLIEKELNRNNYIEAIAFYQGFSLAPLLELLRIKHKPFRYNFRTRYVYYDIPEHLVDRLHSLYFIKDSEDLGRKHEDTKRWFKETLEELKATKIRDLL